jgi:hypothetical protein
MRGREGREREGMEGVVERRKGGEGGKGEKGWGRARQGTGEGIVAYHFRMPPPRPIWKENAVLGVRKKSTKPNVSACEDPK